MADANATVIAPFTAANSTTGLTDPASLGATVPFTGSASVAWSYVS